MILQSVLYFLLGFVAALLILLATAPAIWARAVALTTERVKRALPLSLNELEAHKDHLRADHAMNIRRMELTMTDLRRQNSEQLIEIHKRRDDVGLLREQKLKAEQDIEKLENAAEELRVNIDNGQSTIELLTNENSKLKERLEKLRSEHSDLKSTHSSTVVDLENLQDKVESDRVNFESVSGMLTATELSDDEKIKQLGELKSDLSKAKRSLKSAEIRNQKLEAELAENANKLSQLEQANLKTESKKKKSKPFRKPDVDATSRVVELEAELARLSLQLESKDEEQQVYATKTQSELKKDSDKLLADLKSMKNASAMNGAGSANGVEELEQRLFDFAAETATYAAASDHSLSHHLEDLKNLSETAGSSRLTGRMRELLDGGNIK